MTLTHLVLILNSVFLLVYDYFGPKFGNPSESTVIRDLASKWTILPFIAGLLIGHWFGPRQQVTYSAWGNSVPFLILLLVFDIYWNINYTDYVWYRYPLFYVLMGIPVGMYLWGKAVSWSPIP